jgi:hypothetical protein
VAFGEGGHEVEAATWDICRADFAFDGALIDLVVPGAVDTDWETFWAALQSGPFELRAFRDGEPYPLPGSAARVLADRKEASVVVSVLSGTVTANCHFFGGDLELDIDPCEIVSEAAFESLLAVMRFVAAAVGQPMLAVAEGGTPTYAFLQVSPDGQAAFLRAGSVRHAEQVAAADRGNGD